MLTIGLASVVSCVNDNLADDSADKSAVSMAASLSEQVAAMESSLKDIESLQKEGADFSEAVKTIGEHISFIEAGASWEEGTLATLRLQKTLAADGLLNAGIESWLGEDYAAYYPLAVAQAKSEAAVEAFRKQQLRADALASDVEAGLRTDSDPKALKSLAASVEKNIGEAEALNVSLSEMSAEVEVAYRNAIRKSSSEQPDLETLNRSAAAAVAEADNTLNGLIARISACESQLEDIANRLGALEEEVKDFEELLGMIQSVTFMSEYSEEKVIAYYNLDLNERDGQNRAARVPASTISLNYIVRPASAAAALAEQSLWNNGLNVFGYYADKIQTKAVAQESMIDFNVTDVQVQSESGIVTVTVANSLKNDFFLKNTGAKLALSLATGKTDLTSKFVEIVPKDQSGAVYVEELSLSAGSIEIDNGTTARLTATLTPSNPTTGGVVYTTSNADVATVSSDGVITAKSVGNAVITVETKSINEWGNTLKKTCSVKVNPSVRLTGPNYVEQGGEIELRVESPDYIDPQFITWEIDGGAVTQAYASVTSDNGVGVVYGKGMWFDTDEKAYKPITVNCTIAGAMPVELTHEIRVIAKQPKGIAIEGLNYDQNQISVKKGATYTFNSTLEPAGVSLSYFRIRYQSAQNWIASVDYESGLVKGLEIGTAFIDVKVLDSGTYNYFYPSRNEMVRQIAVVVEPYYVETVTLPSTWDLKVGEEASISAEFTSDGENGELPSDMSLAWSSDNSSVVSVDPATGKMTANAVGTAIITATSTSVPEGAQPKTASCAVTVKEAGAADPKVGDFYYSDGTWSPELDPSKTVIGVVFSTENATGADSKLREAYPGCANGLVVAINEYSSNYGYISLGTNSGGKTFINAGYDLMPSLSDPRGYYNTLGLLDYHNQKDSNGTGLVGNSSVLASHSSVAASPETASSWYIPSYYEMYVISQNLSSINASLSLIDGASVINASGSYWTSTIVWTTDKYNDIMNLKLFDISASGWGATSPHATTNPVRVVLAF